MKDLRAIAGAEQVPGRWRMLRSELVREIRSRAAKDPQLRARVRVKIGHARVSGKRLGAPPDRGESSLPAASLPPSPPPDSASEMTPLPSLHRDQGKPIPDTYGDDRLRLMIRDPYTGYAYWELAGLAMERLWRLHGVSFLHTAQWRLRVDSLLTRTGWQLPVDVHACRAYVPLQPGQLYAIALCFLDAESRLVEVLRAGPAHTPSDAVSPLVDEEWPVAPYDLLALTGGFDRSGKWLVCSPSIWQARLRGSLRSEAES
jgi:hypothetical protein